MFTIPTGGLSIFIYGIILFVGGIFHVLKFLHVNISGVFRFFDFFIGEKYDCRTRRFFSGTIAVILPILLVVGVSGALFDQIRHSELPNRFLPIHAFAAVYSSVVSSTTAEKPADTPPFVAAEPLTESTVSHETVPAEGKNMAPSMPFSQEDLDYCSPFCLRSLSFDAPASTT